MYANSLKFSRVEKLSCASLSRAPVHSGRGLPGREGPEAEGSVEGGGGFVDGVAGGRRASDAGQHTAEASDPDGPLRTEHCCGRGEESIPFSGES